MKIESNKFGSGLVYDINDVDGGIYFECTACMSIYSEALTWANANPDMVRGHPYFAESIVLLCCQVTDLSVLNDFQHLEDLMRRFPNKEFYVSGCLARRFDIPLPGGVKRLANPYSDNTKIEYTNLVTWTKPFWVRHWENGGETASGNLVRNRYPLRISVGCKKKCAYCTIRTTRGEPRELPIRETELVEHPHAVLVADSPSASLLKYGWLPIARDTKTPMALRNVEPDVAIAIWDQIVELNKMGLLDVLHVPVQTDQVNVLQVMQRNVEATEEFISRVVELDASTLIATNVIIDYLDYPNPTKEVEKIFDVVNWNPYWDGTWDRAKAEQRWAKYFPWSKK